MHYGEDKIISFLFTLNLIWNRWKNYVWNMKSKRSGNLSRVNGRRNGVGWMCDF